MRTLFTFIVLGGWLIPNAASAQETDASFAEMLDGQLGRPGGLTADDAARRAGDDSPSIHAAEADLREAEERTSIARQAFIPRLTARLRYSRLSRVDEPQDLPIDVTSIVNQWTTELSLDVPLSDYLLRLPYERRSASHAEDAAAESLEATRRTVALRAQLVYWGWARARLAVSVTEQAHAQAIAHLADTRAGHEVGNASLADVLRAESQVASAELSVVRARADEARTADQLRTIARLPDGARLEIGEELATSAMETRLDVRALLDEAYDQRPELHAMQSLARAERSRSRAVRSGAYPRLSAFFTGQVLNPNQRAFPQEEEWDTAWMAGAEISWGISSVSTTLAQARAAEASADSIDAEAAELRDSIRNDVVDAAEAIREADAAIETTGRGLAAAEEQHRVRAELFRAGRATAAEVIDAETALTGARLDAIQARIDRRVADAQLAAALGR